LQGSLVLDARNHYARQYDDVDDNDDNDNNVTTRTNLGNIDGGYVLDEDIHSGLSTSPSSDETLLDSTDFILSFWEMWDYRGGCRFRGFVAEREEETAMFVFFDEGAFGHGLKPGYLDAKLTQIELAANFEQNDGSH
jgi:Ornithine decarboxylase antizyme